MARAKLVFAALGMALFLLLLGARERKKTGIRSTLATISVVRSAIDAYRADHERKCPPSLDALRAEGYLTSPTGLIEPKDAWGKPLRLDCPGQKEPDGYDLTSDGPDGEIGGLDRVE